MVGEDLMHRPGGAVSLSSGKAHIFSRLPNMDHLMGYWYHFCIMFEALFIMTLIDAGTRVGRYLLQELLVISILNSTTNIGLLAYMVVQL